MGRIGGREEISQNSQGVLFNIDNNFPTILIWNGLQCDGLFNLNSKILCYLELATTKCSEDAEDNFFMVVNYNGAEFSSLMNLMNLKKKSFWCYVRTACDEVIVTEIDMCYHVTLHGLLKMVITHLF